MTLIMGGTKKLLTHSARHIFKVLLMHLHFLTSFNHVYELLSHMHFIAHNLIIFNISDYRYIVFSIMFKHMTFTVCGLEPEIKNSKMSQNM